MSIRIDILEFALTSVEASDQARERLRKDGWNLITILGIKESGAPHGRTEAGRDWKITADVTR